MVVGDRMLAMNDGGEQTTVYLLDAGCQVIDVHTAAVDPYDPEDLAVAADGTVWVADTGDNNAERDTGALIAMRTDGSAGVFRLTYPDGPHDAEALLLAPDGTPYVVTKEVLGASGVYRPVAGLADGGTVAMAKVAAVNITPHRHAGWTGGAGRPLLVTGGAVSRTGAGWPAHLHRRLHLDADRIGHPGRAGRRPGAGGAAGGTAGRGDQLRCRQPHPGGGWGGAPLGRHPRAGGRGGRRGRGSARSGRSRRSPTSPAPGSPRSPRR